MYTHFTSFPSFYPAISSLSKNSKEGNMWWCSVPGVVVVYHLCTALQSVSIATLTLRRNVLSSLMHCCAGGIPSPWLSGGGSPNIYNSKLWVTSDHWQHYAENIFSFEVEKESFALKPMNCPGHWCVWVCAHMCMCVCVCSVCMVVCMCVCNVYVLWMVVCMFASCGSNCVTATCIFLVYYQLYPKLVNSSS